MDIFWLQRKGRVQARNIAILVDSFDAGGAQKQAFLLAKHLGKLNNVTLIVFYGERIERRFEQSFGELSSTPVLLSGGLLKKCFELKRILKEARTEVLFTYLLLPNLVGGIIGALAGVKLKVGGIRNSVLDPKKEPLERLLHNQVNDCSIFNSYSGQTRLSGRGFSAKRSVVIPNCFELTETERIREEKDTVTILSVGRFTEQKDYLTALNVLKTLKNNGVKFKYVVVGWGVLENQIRTWVDERELSDRVELVINPKNVNDYFIEADIFLMTSLFEGLSNAMMEAMSFSLPMVATRAGDNDRLIDEGRNGFLAELKDEKVLSEGLMKLLASSKMRNQFGLHSHRKLQDEYGVDKFVQRYEEFIESKLKRN